MKLRGIAMAAALVALDATSQAAFAGPAAYSWTGGYFGGQLGYGWSSVATGETNVYNDPSGSPDGTLDPFSYSGTGIIGGGEVGYNWQSGPMVLGVVGDFSGANIQGSYTDPDNAFTAESTINWLTTARLNVGVPLGSMLLYGTGGVAFGGLQNGGASSTNTGWTAGVGVEAAVTQNVTARVEYRHTDLGGLPAGGGDYSSNDLLVGVGFKF